MIVFEGAVEECQRERAIQATEQPHGRVLDKRLLRR
jgi:hypothetical protein